MAEDRNSGGQGSGDFSLGNFRAESEGSSLAADVGQGGSGRKRQPRPQKVDADYRGAEMTYLTLSTEDLAGLTFSSGIGSIMLTGTIYFAEQAYSTQFQQFIGALVFFGAATLVSYVYFFGLVARIRTRSGLSRWRIFSE